MLGRCIEEDVNDPKLKTQRDLRHGFVKYLSYVHDGREDS